MAAHVSTSIANRDGAPRSRWQRQMRPFTSCTEGPRPSTLSCKSCSSLLTDLCTLSIGIALADTLDDLISSRRIEPQLAMRIMQTFDQSIASVLGERVKAKLQFKVRRRKR